MEGEELKELKDKPLLHVLNRLQKANLSFTVISDVSNPWESGVEIWLSNGNKPLKFDPETQKMEEDDDSANDRIDQIAVSKNDCREKVFEHPYRILERSFFIDQVQPMVDKNDGVEHLGFLKSSLTQDQNEVDPPYKIINYNDTRQDVINYLGDPDLEEEYDGDSLMSYFDLGLAFVMTSGGNINFRLFSGLPGYNTFGLFQHCSFSLSLRKKRGVFTLKPNTLWNSKVLDTLDPKPTRVWPKLEKTNSMASNNAIHYFKLPGMVLSVSTVSNTVASVTLFREDDQKVKDFWLSAPPSGM